MLESTRRSLRINVIRTILLLLVLCSLSSQSIVTAESSHLGIDVILLIDVSGSMAEQNGDHRKAYESGRWDGSDPLRIRWDAVKLLVDLLDAHDRILILRFNETCPTRTGRYEMMQDGLRKPYSPMTPFLPGRIELTAEKDFPRTLQFCDEMTHRLLADRIALLNRPLNSAPRRPWTNHDQADHEDGWSLDNGGTNILYALQSLNSTLTHTAVNDSASRPKRIILLTDGCDQNVDNFVTNLAAEETDPGYRPRMDRTKLRGELAFLLAPKPIPVYTIGLKLGDLPDGLALENDKSVLGRNNVKPGDRRKKSVFSRNGDSLLLVQGEDEPHFQQSKARELLREISNITGGELQEVDDASGLIQLYTELIRNMKGLWYKEEKVYPGASPELRIPVVSAVADFRMLARKQNSAEEEKVGLAAVKQLISPPVFGQGSWHPASPSLLMPVLRQGTGQSLYALWFGGDLNPRKPGSRISSPFAHLNGPVEWVIPIPREKSVVETTHFKHVLEEFGWPPRRPIGSADPNEDLKFFRHEVGTIELSASTDLLNPKDFIWKLNRQRQDDQPEQLNIVFRNVDHGVRADIDMDRVSPVVWTANEVSRPQSLQLRGTGTATGGGRPEVLTGFSREFPVWRFQIVNALPLRIRETTVALALSEEESECAFTIETQFERVVRNIPLKATLTLPKFKSLDGKLLPLAKDLFVVSVIGIDQKSMPLASSEDGVAKFQLEDGHARLKLQFRNDRKELFPPAGAEIVSGKLRIEPDLTDLARTTPIELPIELVIDRPPLAFYDNPLKSDRRARITVSPNTAESRKVDIYLAPTKPTGNGRMVSLVLDGIKAPEDLDGNVFPFAAEEFRLLNEQGKELTREGGGWTTEYLGQPIHLMVETALKRDRRPDTTAVAKLTAVGLGFAQGDLEIHWTFQPRKVELAVIDEDHALLREPGQTVNYRLTGKVMNHPEGAHIPITASLRANGLRFENLDRDQAKTDFLVSLDELGSISAGGTSLAETIETNFHFSVPEGQPLGEYRAELSFEESAVIGEGETKHSVGVKLARQYVTLKLTLDRLIAEIQDPHHPGNWVAAERVMGDNGEEYHLMVHGWLGTEFKRQFRVRSERGEAMSAEIRPRVMEAYRLITDAGRPAAADLNWRSIGESSDPVPEWDVTFPVLNNRDPNHCFASKIVITRAGALQRTIKLNLKLMSDP